MANLVSIFNILQTTIIVGILIYLMRDTIINTIKEIVRGSNVAEIKLRGPIKETKDSFAEDAISSSNVVKKLENLKEDKYEAVIININTPGGSPVPSDDIRRALERLNLPAFTYTRSLCASGGYMIACGTDHIHARQDSLIGSIGVIGSQYKLSGLAEKYGVDYERFVGGDHKDTHRPLKDLNDEERGYWQSVIDESYENFVSLVSDSRDVEKEVVKETQAEVMSPENALDKGLVDSVGSREDLKKEIKDFTGLETLYIKQSNGGSLSFNRVDAMFGNIAFSFGKGIASVFTKSQSKKIEYRI